MSKPVAWAVTEKSVYFNRQNDAAAIHMSVWGASLDTLGKAPQHAHRRSIVYLYAFCLMLAARQNYF